MIENVFFTNFGRRIRKSCVNFCCWHCS